MKTPSSYLAFVYIGSWTIRHGLLKVECAPTASPTHDNEKVDVHVARREGNLDHWDPITMATYMGIDFDTSQPLPEPHKAADSSKPVDTYAGHDAAIMFYAQWCPNCHALAPLWDKIATMLKAGTKESNLIMALFNCEGSTKHTELCNAAGVTHYPTLMFVGRDALHQRTTKKERQILGSKYKKLRRVARFRGNWQYGEQILDWISFNQSWSKWKDFSFNNPLMRKLRQIFTLPFLRHSLDTHLAGANVSGGKIEDGSLPVGIPKLDSSSTSNVGIGSDSVSGAGASKKDQELTQLNAILDASTKKVEELQKAATHAGLLIDSMLLQNTTQQTNETESGDVFTYMKQHNVYARAAAPNSLKNDTDAVLLKSCVSDLNVDYCHRVLMNIVNDPIFVSSFDNAIELGEEKLVTEIEKKLYEQRNSTEPFCAFVDDCVANEFRTPECQPDKCPFENDLACRYVSTCQSQPIMDEYREELKRLQDEMQSTTNEGTKQPKQSTSGWGVAS